MNKHYLIDYENIKCFKELVDNSEDSKQYLFYTDNCPNINIDIVSKFKNMEFIKAFKGNQSLDMCLSSYIGFLIANIPDEEYYIISNDCDYDTVINFWRNRGAKINRVQQVSKKVEHNAVIIQYLRTAGIAAGVTGEIASIVAQLYQLKNGKQRIYLELIKKYGKSTGGKYYNTIKKVI